MDKFKNSQLGKNLQNILSIPKNNQQNNKPEPINELYQELKQKLNNHPKLKSLLTLFQNNQDRHAKIKSVFEKLFDIIDEQND